jgi:hypothetical protein
MTARGTTLAVLALLCCAGCEDEAADARLRGSLSTVYPLAHDTVRARLTRSELAIEYIRGDGQTAVRLSLEADSAAEGRVIDLAETGTLTGQVDDLILADLVTLSGGTATLDQYAADDGEAVTGSFEATLDAPRGTLTLTGEFEASLEVTDSRR